MDAKPILIVAHSRSDFLPLEFPVLELYKHLSEMSLAAQTLTYPQNGNRSGDFYRQNVGDFLDTVNTLIAGTGVRIDELAATTPILNRVITTDPAYESKPHLVIGGREIRVTYLKRPESEGIGQVDYKVQMFLDVLGIKSSEEPEKR